MIRTGCHFTDTALPAVVSCQLVSLVSLPKFVKPDPVAVLAYQMIAHGIRPELFRVLSIKRDHQSSS